jgi:hypothetical protein
MLNISINETNRNDQVDSTKRAERNRVRRIRRHLKNSHCDMRKIAVGAIKPIAVCEFCHHGEARQCIDSLPACDSCAEELR